MRIMSEKECKRLAVIKKVEQRQLKGIEAAKVLGVSVRHLRRMLSRYRIQGSDGMISKKRGRMSNRQHGLQSRQQAIKLLNEECQGFGPSFASEKLRERNGIHINR